MKTPECKICDVENAVHKSRAYWVCGQCGRDVSLEYVLIWEMKKNRQSKRVEKLKEHNQK